METLTMNIEREYFARIVAKKKLYESRQQSYFWKQRIEPLSGSCPVKWCTARHPV